MAKKRKVKPGFAFNRQVELLADWSEIQESKMSTTEYACRLSEKMGEDVTSSMVSSDFASLKRKGHLEGCIWPRSGRRGLANQDLETILEVFGEAISLLLMELDVPSSSSSKRESESLYEKIENFLDGRSAKGVDNEEK